MYFRLTEQTKYFFIEELRDYWKYHPGYPELANNIIGKFKFSERPQYGIVVKTGSGSHIPLSADSYIGVVESFVHLTKVKNFPGLAVEWVREDELAIIKNNGKFPSLPGIYYIDLTEDREFYVDCLLDARNDVLVKYDDYTFQCHDAPYIAGSIKLYEMPNGYLLREGVDYTVTLNAQSHPTGEIKTRNPISGSRYLVADYRYAGPSTGPYGLFPNHENNSAIPGCVLAFGRKNKKGDRVAVIVDPVRNPVALEYGGKWDLSVDLEISARDVYAQQEIADQTAIYLWGILRPKWSSDGIEMTEISLGGESEEVYDEAGDDYMYNSSISVTIQTNWSVYVPLDIYIRQVSPDSTRHLQDLSELTDEQIRNLKSQFRIAEVSGLEAFRDPYFRSNIPAVFPTEGVN